MPLGELPRRIAHQASSAAFGLITMSAAMDKSYVRVLSQATWDEVASLQLDQNEAGCSIVSVQHPTDDDAEVRSVSPARSHALPTSTACELTKHLPSVACAL